ALANLNDSTFGLVDLDDTTSAFPAGLPLGIDVGVLENELDHSIVQVSPSGILPFGHLLALEVRSDLRGLGVARAPSAGAAVAATFTTAAAPPGTLRDTLIENFDTTTHEETDPTQLAPGVLTADWDRLGSGVLTAGFAFQGSGQIGRFAP